VVGIHTAAVLGTLTHEKVADVNPEAVTQLEAMMEQLTQMTMLRRRPEVEHIAETAAFLASERAGAITSGIVNVTSGLVAG
jgi:enoyl-[acyl-carrier-protein] reductase (NADH)